MKGVLLFVCAVIAHVNSQYSCGCSSPPLTCRSPPAARPLTPCPPPTPVCSCPPPTPVCSCPPPTPVCSCPPPTPVCSCPPPIPVCPRPLPPCPRPCPAPVVEILDYNVPVSPVTYEFVTPCSPLPTCNCPTLPSLPVSSQVLPSLGCPVITSPILNPCLGGLAEVSPVAPVGLINPFLPAASPISALAPTVSSLYPPICPCNCGCKYLRQIPIPPPFI